MSHPRRERVIILALWLMILASSSQLMIIAPILPRIGEELAVPEALQGTLISGFALSMSLFALVVGPISDHVGRRAVLVWGTGAMTGALLAHPLAHDYPSLLGMRILTGAAAGLLTGAAVAYIGDYFSYERRGWAAGWVMSGIAVGQLAGVPAGTVLAGRYGFEAPFVLFAVVMAASFVLTVTAVPQPTAARSEGPLSLRSGLRSYAELCRSTTVVGACVAYGSMFFSTWCFLIYFPTWAETSLHMTPNAIASLFAAGGVASVLAGPAAGRLSDRVGRRPLIIASCVGTAALFSLATVLMTAHWAAYGLFFAATIFITARRPPLQALLTALVPAARRGSLMSLVVAIGQLGGGIGAALAGLLYTDVGFIGCTLLAAGMILVTAAVVALWLPEPVESERRGSSR